MKEDIKEILTSFLSQVENHTHSTNHYPTNYAGLKLKVGFGVGKTAKIPWITFLAENQEPQMEYSQSIIFLKNIRSYYLLMVLAKLKNQKRVG